VGNSSRGDVLMQPRVACPAGENLGDKGTTFRFPQVSPYLCGSTNSRLHAQGTPAERRKETALAMSSG